MTQYFRMAKEHGVQWQRNGNYWLTCTPGHVAAQSDRHGNCATVHTVVLRKFRAACVSKITVEITTSCHTIIWEKRSITEGVSVVLRPVMSLASALLSLTPCHTSCTHFSPLKDGLAQVWADNSPKLSCNNPVSSHILTVGFTAQISTSIYDLTCRWITNSLCHHYTVTLRDNKHQTK